MSPACRSRRVAFSAFVLALVGVQGASAEVRLAAGGRAAPDVRVTWTLDGPWTPVGPTGSATLNPRGDAHGDGAPAWTVSGGKVLAAWTRGEDHVVAFAIGQRAWESSGRLPSANAMGTPAVVALDREDRWLVAWQEVEDGARAMAAIVGADATVSPSVVVNEEALLLGAVAIEPGVLVAWLDDSSRFHLTEIVLSARDEPATAPMIGATVEVVFAGGNPTPGPGPFPEVPKWTLARDQQPEAGTATSGGGSVDPAAVRLTLHEVTMQGGQTRRVLTWWLHPWLLGHAEVTASGPVGMARVLAAPPGAPWSPAVVKAALKLHRD